MLPLKTLDETKLSLITTQFYNAFDSRFECPDLSTIIPLFCSTASIYLINDEIETCVSINEFIAPRQRGFNDRRYVNFHEWETSSQTMGNSNVAIRASYFSSAGLIDNQLVNRDSFKLFNYINTSAGWKIVSLIWRLTNNSKDLSRA